MRRCALCVIPDTRPDTHFEDGVCSACRSYRKRETVNWEARRRMLCDLLEKNRNTSGFDCIVPSSGGKDSTWQVLKLLELGARPLVVTATTCHLTAAGRANIDNLARYATTIEVTPNRAVRARLNRLGLRLVGDVSWPEHVSIFTTPFRIACQLGIPLVFYGENPQEAYGGPPGADEALELTRRWRSEFGGFLGLRPSDMVGQDGIDARDMADYEMPTEADMERVGVEAHFLGVYEPWDSHLNVAAARGAGMKVDILPCEANWWRGENLDNIQTGLHDHGMFLKYGYGRACAQVSVDIRSGRLDRARGLRAVHARDGRFPERYLDVHWTEVCEHIGMSPAEVYERLLSFSNTEVVDAFDRERQAHQDSGVRDAPRRPTIPADSG